MIYTSENNWYKWHYGNDTACIRQTGTLPFYTSYAANYTLSVKSFKEEMVLAAKSTLDHYPSLRPCILFSGGTESELVLRSYIEIGSNPKVLIMRYENDYNIYDVSYAITICLMLGVPYKIVDFNLKHFYENDAELISDIAQIDRPRALPHLKFIDYVDGLAIFGIGDPRWSRTASDYSTKGNWLLLDQEHDTAWDKYIIEKNIPAIAQWFKWSPGLVLSYLNLDWFKKLTNDHYTGREGVTSTKLIGYREAYPKMISRAKYTGFENVDHLITEFESFLLTKYNGTPYRQIHTRTLSQLLGEIRGN